jgi:Uma2 family endonuclease
MAGSAAVAFDPPPLYTWEQFAEIDEGEGMRGVELVDGILEGGEMPTRKHGRIVTRLVGLLLPWLDAHGGGELLTQENRVRITRRVVRKPDLFLVRAEDHPVFSHETLVSPPYLVVEVVTKTQRDEERDRITKRAEYEQISARGYWIIDPAEDTLEVLTLGADGLYGAPRRYGPKAVVEGGGIGFEGLRFRVGDLGATSSRSSWWKRRPQGTPKPPSAGLQR